VIATAWRIVKRKHAKSAFSGDGARRFGGRWNSPGIGMVYTAQSQALAALEMLVHLDSSNLLQNYVLFEVGFDEALTAALDPSRLPKNWRTDPPPAKVRAIGDAWIRAGSSAVLRVPSTVVPSEFNYLLNPGHPDFGRLQIGQPSPFRFDPRLTRK
jgi:RES domain-containing protein